MSDVGSGVAPKDIWVSISGIDSGDDTWATSSGPGITNTSEKHYNGGKATPLRYAGRATFDSLSLSRPTQYPRDQIALLALRADVKAGTVQRTLIVYTSSNGAITSEAFLGYCMSVTPPSGDADSTGKTELACVFDIIVDV